jgi:serine/threonine-protein kinase
VRLVEAASESVLWSESFGAEADARAFEERVMARVSAGVLTTLFPGASPTRSAGTACTDGWEAYRTGALLANRGTAADLEKSVPYLEAAGCGAAQAALADVWSRLARLRPSKDAWERARTAARLALASGSEFAAAHLALANAAMWKDWDWPAAEREFRSALRLNPSNPDAHHDQAWLMMALGRKRAALASLERSVALDPLSARTQVHGGWLYLHADRFREAAAQARRALELDPGMGEARACLSRALLYAGDERGALDAILPLVPEERRAAVAKLSTGEAIRAVYEKSLPMAGADPYQRAWRLAYLGSREEALTQLEEALRLRSASMPLVAADPAFGALRGEARFRKVVEAMGL